MYSSKYCTEYCTERVEVNREERRRWTGTVQYIQIADIRRKVASRHAGTANIE
jgi:hypothetical protein